MSARVADICEFIEIPFDAVIAWGEKGGEGRMWMFVKRWEIEVR